MSQTSLCSPVKTTNYRFSLWKHCESLRRESEDLDRPMELTKSRSLTMEKKWALQLLVITSLTFIFILVTAFNMGLLSYVSTVNPIFSIFRATNHSFNVTAPAAVKLALPAPPPAGPAIPRLAYLVSGSKGDLDRLWRTLRALYHPRNIYVVHFDLESPAAERAELAERVANDTLFAKVGNVHVIEKSNMVTYRGATMVASTLHACAILLKKSKDWDWFINLSASDYPLVTQDDILYTLAPLPRNLNFIECTSRLGWKEEQRAKPIIVDPGLYNSKKSDVFYVTRKRELPTAFKLFTGSAWMALSREFVEFCILGWDNLPRTLLMYYTNFLSSPEGYFQTVICNSPQFAKTAVNHDLHYIAWDMPPKQHPHTLGMNDTQHMIGSNAPFARKFNRSDPVLDKIDAELLRRKSGSFIPGGWCSGSSSNPCSDVGDPTELKPGPGARRLANLMLRLLHPKKIAQNQCK